MNPDKTKLLQDIEAMKEKLASMEEELNKPEVFKHFPSKFDTYHYYTPTGSICSITASDDDLRANTYKTSKEAHEAYKKAVAVEKIKRRILELQGNWKPDWSEDNEKKYYIHYDHYERKFIHSHWFKGQQYTPIPYMKHKDIAELIISELEDELKLIFDIV